MLQIFMRDLKQYLPDIQVFLRLTLMALVGVLSVLATLLLIVIVTKGKVMLLHIDCNMSYFVVSTVHKINYILLFFSKCFHDGFLPIKN